MRVPESDFERNVMFHAECYWKSWNGDAEAIKVGRFFEPVDQDSRIDVLVKLCTRIGGWGLDALRMECCRCRPERPKSMDGNSTATTTLSLVDIGDRCFHGLTSIRESRAEIAEFVKNHDRAEIVAGVAALMIDIKAKGREALRRSCGIAECQGAK